MEYPSDIDKECVAICDKINSLPGTQTIESCCGHLKDPYRIWFKCDDNYSLAIIARVFDKRYSGTNYVYHIKITTCDMKQEQMYVFCVESESPYNSNDEMNEDIKEICKNFDYWMDEKFYEYFNKK